MNAIEIPTNTEFMDADNHIIDGNSSSDVLSEGTSISPYTMSCVLTRPNQMILSKYKASIIETKLLLMTLYEAQISAGQLPIMFSTKQLISTLKLNPSSYIYGQLKTACDGLSRTRFLYENLQDEHFIFVNIIESAEFKNGILEVKLTEWARNNIFALKSNFTPMLMPVLMSFGTHGKSSDQTNYSLRLYELLKTKLYRCSDERPHYTFKLSLTDTMFSIGVIDPSDPGITKAIRSGKALGMTAVELARAASKKESVSFVKYSAFNERVLRKAQREICNGATDLEFNYREERAGKSVKYIVFTIWRNEKFASDNDESGTYQLIKEVEKIIHEPLKTNDILRILSAAGNNLEKVKNAYEMSKKSSTKIENLTAWLIAAIRRDWKMREEKQEYPVETGGLYNMQMAEKQDVTHSQRKGGRRNPFNDFEQNQYDFDQLEKELLGELLD